MQYKLICSDIDGTLLNKDRALSKRTIEAIMNLKDIPFILISARMPSAMRYLQEQLSIEGLPMIAYNGGLVLDGVGEKVVALSSVEVPMRVTQAIVQFNQKPQLHTSLYHSDEWYVPELDYWAKREWNNTKVEPTVSNLNQVCEDWSSRNIGPHKIMCMGEPSSIDELAKFLNINHKEEVNFYRSKDTYLEISSKQISKFSAIELLLEKKFACDLSEVMAFGDNYNDVEMINGVGHGVAVANARKETLAVANQITAKNTEEGVALVLESLNLNK